MHLRLRQRRELRIEHQADRLRHLEDELGEVQRQGVEGRLRRAEERLHHVDVDAQQQMRGHDLHIGADAERQHLLQQVGGRSASEKWIFSRMFSMSQAMFTNPMTV